MQIQYLPNKSDKFVIKFWPASDVNSKYVVNGFPYWGKQEMKQLSVEFDEFLVVKFVEPFIQSWRRYG